MTLNASYIGPNNYDNQVTTDRKILEYISGGLSGVTASGADGGSNLQVSPVPGQHLARVAPGPAFLLGRNDPVNQGSYIFTNDAIETVSLPNPLSNPFIATVIVRVVDPQYGAVVGSIGPRIDVLSGNPASQPVPISDTAINALGVPGGWTRLADIRINTGDTGAVPVAQFTDKRILLPARAGDPILCDSSARPPGVLGRTILERNTKRLYIHDGTNYRLQGSIREFHRGVTPKGENGTQITPWITWDAVPCLTHMVIDFTGAAGFETVAVDVGVTVVSDTAGIGIDGGSDVLVRAPAGAWTTVNRQVVIVIPPNVAGRWYPMGLAYGGQAYWNVQITTNRYAA